MMRFLREEPFPGGVDSRLRQGFVSDIGAETLGLQNLALKNTLEISSLAIANFLPLATHNKEG